MSGKISIGGGGIDPKKIRSWLITALFVFVALNILLAVIRPFIPLIIVGIIFISLGGFVFRRYKHM